MLDAVDTHREKGLYTGLVGPEKASWRRWRMLNPVDERGSWMKGHKEQDSMGNSKALRTVGASSGEHGDVM